MKAKSKPKSKSKPKNNQEYIKLFAEILIGLSETEEWGSIVKTLDEEKLLNNELIHKQARIETLLSVAFGEDPF